MKRLRVLAVTAGVLAGLVPAAPAAAFSPPELFVRMQPWDTHEPVGDWIPLASAPALAYLGGYQIGYRLQASGEPNELQRVALTVAGVPEFRVHLLGRISWVASLNPRRGARLRERLDGVDWEPAGG